MQRELLKGKIDMERRKIEILEAMVEDRTRELYYSNEELRTAFDFLREIYKTMPCALMVFDQHGRIEAINEELPDLLGYSQTDLIGTEASTIFESGEAPVISELKELASTQKILKAEKRFRRKDGRIVPVLFSATVIAGNDGQPGRVVCAAVDITELRRLESELAQAQKLESVGRLAAGIAHEINTPLQFVGDSVHFIRDAMKDVTELIGKYQVLTRAVASSTATPSMAEEIAGAEEELDLPYVLAQVPKALERALDGLNRVTLIVRSMKEFAHPDQKEKTTVNLNQSIQSTLTIARNEYKYVADLETNFGELPPVICHAGEINQVILNIIVNAAHAIADKTKGAGPKGRIQVRTWDESGDAVVAVSDTGGGIPEGIRHKIFDPFFTTKEVGRGTGQGLAIARSIIVDKHGGRIDLETEEGEGTTFYIRLPINPKNLPEAG